MRHISTVDARNQFSDVINRASFGKERFILTRRGRDIAAIVPIADLALIEAKEDDIDVALALEVLAKYKKDEGVTLEELAKALGVNL